MIIEKVGGVNAVIIVGVGGETSQSREVSQSGSGR